MNENCANKKIVDLSAGGMQEYIIDLHNEARNVVAAGNVTELPAAAKMLKAVSPSSNSDNL